MRLTQLLVFELGTGCNLARIHPACPSGHPERFAARSRRRILGDDLIVAIARRMYRQFGFRGLVAWHYYNEPLLKAGRMFTLMARIRAAVPEARFLLWTNGTLATLPATLPRLGEFDQIHVTDYALPDLAVDRTAILAANPRAQFHRWPLDRRLDPPGDWSDRACWRPFVEFIIDAHGTVHLCCYDWRGRADLGSVYDGPLEDLVAHWQRVRDLVASSPMSDGAPAACLGCAMRPGRPCMAGFVPEIAAEAAVYAHSIPPPPPVPRRKIGVVLVAYRIPELRIADHFRWNDALYRQGRTTVYVVSDRRCPGPGYARWIVFPEADLPLRNGRRVFSLTATKNRGIDAALADGCQVLVVTDIDMAFPDPTWHRMTGCRRGEAIVPVYVLAPAFDSRVTCTAAAEDPGCEGTVAMTAADWRRVRFDERCIGYGADDGILHKAIARAGIRHDRQFRVYHIAHTPVAADSRVPGHGRGDCWNRADGFNPDNFAENRRLYDAHR